MNEVTRRELPDVAVLSVATNRYMDYWSTMALTADRFLQPSACLTFYVFTDQPERAHQLGARLARSKIVPVHVPDLRWPDATLRRYELYAQHWSAIDEPVVMHSDADMEFCSKSLVDPVDPPWPGGIAFVRHPGYRRPRVGSRLRLYSKSPRYIKSDLASWLEMGNLGAWETSKQSLAYVPRVRRRAYVCGGIWMGLNEPLGQMVSSLARRTESDSSRGVVANWHDESHLNWYASQADHFLYDSNKCFAPGYLNLQDLEPEIIAVDKGDNRTR